MHRERREANWRRERVGLSLAVMLLALVAGFVVAPSAARASGQILQFTGNGAIGGTYGTFNSFASSAGRTLVTSPTLPLDLSPNACVLLPDNTTPFDAAQTTALQTYINAGGTIVAMAENELYPGGPPGVATMNLLASALGVGISGGSNAIDTDYNRTTRIGSSEFTLGVSSIGYAFTNSITTWGTAAVLVSSQGATGVPMVGVQSVGLGKFVYSGDTNIFSDYLGAPYVLDSNARFAKNLCGDTKPPNITIVTPPDGARYKAGAAVPADWSCTDADSAGDPLTKTATAAVGNPIDTQTSSGVPVPATTSSGLPTLQKSFTVTCTDSSANIATKTHTYFVDQSPPEPQISVPLDGGTYGRSGAYAAAWSCADPDGAPDVAVKTGTTPVGGSIDTSMPNGGPVQKSFTVTCTDQVGNSATKTVSYTVKDTSAPSATITLPSRVRLGQTVAAVWTCADADGPADIDSDPNKTFGTVANGQPIYTGAAGLQTFSVTCTDLAGNAATKDVTYVVDGSPPIPAITAPVDGGSYPRGLAVAAAWSCVDDDGPADIDTSPSKTFGTRSPGQGIDTAATGAKTFKVTCTDLVGNTASKTVTYTVVDASPPEITIAVPAANAKYTQGQVVSPSYTCKDADGPGDIKSCIRDGGATGPVDTSKPGTFVFTVNASDLAGNTATASVRYTVVAKTTSSGGNVSPTAQSGTTAPKVCKSRRQFKIRVKKLRGGVSAVSATVFVNGRKTLVRKGKRITATVTLKGLKKGRYKVVIKVKYSNGRTLSYTRRFKTCTPKGK